MNPILVILLITRLLLAASVYRVNNQSGLPILKRSYWQGFCRVVFLKRQHNKHNKTKNSTHSLIVGLVSPTSLLNALLEASLYHITSLCDYWISFLSVNLKLNCLNYGRGLCQLGIISFVVFLKETIRS